jgi:hypothetical protein
MRLKSFRAFCAKISRNIHLKLVEQETNIVSEFVSISSASKTLGRSRTWVRSKAVELEKEGHAVIRDGKWEVNINALVSVRGATKDEREAHTGKSEETEWAKLVQILREENQDLRAENKQLRAEMMALLNSKSGGLSRWFRS